MYIIFETFNLILTLIFGFALGVITMKLATDKDNQKLITSKIAERYIQVHGSPVEQWQQCELDFIVYDDITNCEP